MRTIGVIQKRSSSTREKLGGQVPPSREDLDERLRGARELVAKAMKGGAGPPEMETALLDGDPAAALAEQGIELDLLVVGSHGYGPLLRTLLGGVSTR
jgi:nucleotide-binding universal stress UspA family protein